MKGEFTSSLRGKRKVAAPVPLVLKKTLVLVGMMGAGKTAVGTSAARMLGVPFLDQDEEIERAANRSIAEIFRHDGEAFFRQKETQVLGRLLQGPTGILSTGGGAFLREENRALIARHGVAVWLKADLDLLWARVRHRTTRPLLKTPDPYGTLKALYEARVPVYALAPIHVQTSAGYTVEDTARALIKAIAAHPEVLKVYHHVPPR
jgi:shikimate kinase